MAEPKLVRAPLLWTAYVLAPAAGWGFLDGVPIGLFGGLAICLIWWTWGNTKLHEVPQKIREGRFAAISPWWIAGLIALKLTAGLFLLGDRGLTGDYFANAQWAPPVQRSIQFGVRSFTRIDRRLAFGGTEAPEFPLYFLNDDPDTAKPRDPRNAPGPLGNDAPQFSATWQGYVWVPVAKDRQSFYLRGTGVTAELWVDGSQTVRLDPPAGDAVDRTLWPAGMRRITVRLIASQGRNFDAGFVDDDGRKTPFDETAVFTRPFATSRMTLDRVVRLLGKLVDGVLLALLLWAVVMAAGRRVRDLRGPERRRASVGLAWLGAVAWACLFALPSSGHVALLGGNPHYLSYERDARAMMLGGPSFMFGHVYVYFVALSHLVFGEDLAGLYFMQGLLEVAVVLAVWRVSTVLFGKQIGKAGLTLAVLYFIVLLRPVASSILSVNLFIPLVAGLAVLLIDSSTTGVRSRARRLAVVVILAIGIVEIARLLPAMSFRALTAKALFALGFFSILAPEAGVAPGLIATWWAALIGVAAAMWGSTIERRSGASRLVPAALGLSYFIFIVLVFPRDNVDRLVLPFYILLLPYAALGMMRAVDFLVPPEEE